MNDYTRSPKRSSVGSVSNSAFKKVRSANNGTQPAAGRTSERPDQRSAGDRQRAAAEATRPSRYGDSRREAARAAGVEGRSEPYGDKRRTEGRGAGEGARPPKYADNRGAGDGARSASSYGDKGRTDNRGAGDGARPPKYADNRGAGDGARPPKYAENRGAGDGARSASSYGDKGRTENRGAGEGARSASSYGDKGRTDNRGAGDKARPPKYADNRGATDGARAESYGDKRRDEPRLSNKGERTPLSAEARKDRGRNHWTEKQTPGAGRGDPAANARQEPQPRWDQAPEQTDPTLPRLERFRPEKPLNEAAMAAGSAEELSTTPSGPFSRSGTTGQTAAEEARVQEKRRLVCGIHSVLALLEDAGNAVETVTMLRGLRHPRADAIVNLAKERGAKLRFVERDILDRMSEGTVHQGVAALAGLKANLSWEQFMERLTGTPHPLLLLLDGIEDPRNFGAIVRSAEAFGVLAILVPKDRSAPLTEAALKTAAGAAERIDVVRVTNMARTIDILQAHGVRCIGLADEEQNRLEDADLKGPLALVMGNEGTGLRHLTREKCTQLAGIPLVGRTPSLNVAVATGVALYEANRQRTGLSAT